MERKMSFIWQKNKIYKRTKKKYVNSKYKNVL